MAVQLTQEMINGAKETERVTGVPSSITLAQIILESSGKYEGGMSYLAYKGNNLFGVKSFSESDQRILVKDRSGRLVAWKKYDTVYDSIVDHGSILQLDRYKSRYQNATSVSDYAQALQDGGYAGNDTTYASNLMSVVNSYNLNQYNLNTNVNLDQESLNNTTSTDITGVESQTTDINTSTELGIIGSILKYIAILLISIIGVFFILKSLKIEL